MRRKTKGLSVLLCKHERVVRCLAVPHATGHGTFGDLRGWEKEFLWGAYIFLLLNLVVLYQILKSEHSIN